MVCPDFRDHVCHFQTYAPEKLRPDFRDQGGNDANLWLRKWRDRRDQTQQFPEIQINFSFSDREGESATFQTNMETARLTKSDVTSKTNVQTSSNSKISDA